MLIVRKSYSVENGNIINDREIVKVYNNLFTKIIKTSNITQTNNSDSIIKNFRNPTVKAIVEYHNHSSILTFKKDQKWFSFYFSPYYKRA